MLNPTLPLVALAALPIILIVFLLIGLKWPVVRSACAGLMAAAAVAFLAYQTSGRQIITETLKGAWSSISIIIVIFPAILIYEINLQSGAFPAIKREFTRLLPDKLLQILALGWCFASFLQGPSGFGAPIAVTAPLLVAVGVKPLWAVAIPLLGHGWANTFGTLALAWDALVQQVDGTPDIWFAAACWAGFFLFLMNVLAGLFICWFHNGIAGVRHGAPAVAVLGLVMGGGQMALTVALPSLSTVIPTTIALGIALLMAKTGRYSGSHNAESSIMAPIAAKPPSDGKALSLHQALLPYYALTVISLAVLLIPSLNARLGSWATGFSFPEFTTGHGFISEGSDNYSPIAWLTHSGFFLLFSALLSGFYYALKGNLSGADAGTALRRTWSKALPASLSVVLLISMSRIMGGSGQTEMLARSVAGLTGSWYGLFSPLAGALGAFISSSNVSSNILFGKFQSVTAVLTGCDVAVILAAQTCGGALGCIVSPSKAMLGAATAGVAGQEGAIIGKLMGIVIFCAALIGALAMMFG